MRRRSEEHRLLVRHRPLVRVQRRRPRPRAVFQLYGHRFWWLSCRRHCRALVPVPGRWARRRVSGWRVAGRLPALRLVEGRHFARPLAVLPLRKLAPLPRPPSTPIQVNNKNNKKKQQEKQEKQEKTTRNNKRQQETTRDNKGGRTVCSWMGFWTSLFALIRSCCVTRCLNRCSFAASSFTASCVSPSSSGKYDRVTSLLLPPAYSCQLGWSVITPPFFCAYRMEMPAPSHSDFFLSFPVSTLLGAEAAPTPAPITIQR